MTSNPPLLTTSLPGFSPTRQGKVRDIYDAGDQLVLVATDRLSAFDHVLGSGIPDKGRVLTQLSAFWFARTASIVPNHLITLDVQAYPAQFRAHAELLHGRSMLVRKTTPIRIECVARGFVAGSAWKEYQETGSVCGVRLPAGLREAERLPRPIFTPATKADSGHDVNITAAEASALIGADLVTQLERLTLALYEHGADHAKTHGILLADTKFEFGVAPDGALLLIDEVLTPDSSRYWPVDGYEPGRSPLSFDKQYVRDYLEAIHWNKQPPVPTLPDEVVAQTRAKYLEAYRRLTGQELA